MSQDPQVESALTHALDYSQDYPLFVADIRQRNLGELQRMYSDLYRRERECSEWIDLGGES